MRTVALAVLVTLSACQKQASDPPGDCAAVAETLASIELGNYADPAVRGPVVAKKQADCTAAHITVTEAECLAKATSKYSAAACVPRMFPDVKIGGTADCANIASRVKDLLVKEMGQAGSQALGMIDKMMPALQQSCIEDAWPAEVKKCFLDGKDAAAIQACTDAMPKEMQQRTTERMEKAARF